MRERRTLCRFLALCAIIAVAIWSVPIDARAVYRSSVPANGTTVVVAPAQIFVTFTDVTSATQGNGSVTDARGAVVSTGWTVDPSDRTTMTIALKPDLGSGVYTVQYSSYSENDGQAADGSFIFTVAPGAATSVRSGGSGGAPWGFVLAVGLAVFAFIACGLVIVLRSRREYLAMMAREAARKRDEKESGHESNR